VNATIACGENDGRSNDKCGDVRLTSGHLCRNARPDCCACSEEQHNAGSKNHEPPVEEERLHSLPCSCVVLSIPNHRWLVSSRPLYAASTDKKSDTSAGTTSMATNIDTAGTYEPAMPINPAASPFTHGSEAGTAADPLAQSRLTDQRQAHCRDAWTDHRTRQA
jgi:hypothetical protein